MSEEWMVEFHCPNPQVVGAPHKSEGEARASAHELAVTMYNIAQSDMEGDSVYQTVMVVRPDGSKFQVYA